MKFISVLVVCFLSFDMVMAYDRIYECEDHGETFQTAVPTTTDGYEVITNSYDDMMSQHKRKFGLKRKYWKNGWGYNDTRNGTPLKNTLKSLELLKISKNTSLNNRKPINYMYGRMNDYIDNIQPKCARDANASAVGMRPGINFNNKIILFLNVYGTNLLYLTSTIVHEGRHKKKPHNVMPWSDKGDCTWGGSCDTTYNYYGANAYELAYMWAYGVHSSNSTTYTRQLALYTAQAANQNAFVTSPNFNIPTVAK